MEPGSSQWCQVVNKRQKLMHRKFHLNIRKNNFTVWLKTHWNRRPREVAECPSLEIFKNHLDTILSSVPGLPCLSRENGPDDTLWSLPTFPSLWFYDIFLTLFNITSASTNTGFKVSQVSVIMAISLFCLFPSLPLLLLSFFLTTSLIWRCLLFVFPWKLLHTLNFSSPLPLQRRTLSS